MRKSKITSLLLAATIALTPASSLAHGGRTDGNGGHKDNKNASGLGGYHYHHGNGPHLHPGGVCSLSSTSTKKSTSSSKTKSSSTSSAKKEDIKKVQAKLNELGYDCGTPDGVAGKKTATAIKQFQKDKGLAADGLVGAQTKAAMGI